MTVAQLRRDMSNDEFVHWTRWHARKAQRQQLAEREAGP